MKTVQQIIDHYGGLDWLRRPDNWIRLEPPGWMPLVIEFIGTGLRGLPLVSVAHYGEQNGDAMRDPEMTFEVGDPVFGPDAWGPVSFRNDYAGVEQWAVLADGADGRVLIRPRLVKELKQFMRLWDRNLKQQGFLDWARAHPPQPPVPA